MPLMAAAAPVASAPRTPEEAEAARRLAEADAALRSGDTTIQLVPPFGELRSGMQRFDTLTTGPGIDKVTFSLDGKPVLTKKSPPFSVELDLGGVPRTRTLAVAAYDAKGETLASDELQINATGNRFRVHLAEPQKGKRYESSLLARAEVEAPEGETLERVELYLNEAKIATIYQPPYLHPVVLPKGDSLAYVRAVAFLTDGNSTESLVFVNAPEEMAQVNVDFVELYATVLDRKGRPVTSGLSAQRLHRRRGRRPAADRPLRAGDRPADPRRRGDRHLGLDGAPPGEGAGRGPAVPAGDGAPQGPRRGDHLQRPPGAGGQVHPRHQDAGRRPRRPQGRARHRPLRQPDLLLLHLQRPEGAARPAAALRRQGRGEPLQLRGGARLRPPRRGHRLRRRPRATTSTKRSSPGSPRRPAAAPSSPARPTSSPASTRASRKSCARRC